MKVNLNCSFRDYKGLPIEGTNISDMVCKSLFSVATLDGRSLSLDEKYMAYKLCNKIMRAVSDVTLSSEETVFIQKICSEVLTAGAIGQLKDLLENNV